QTGMCGAIRWSTNHLSSLTAPYRVTCQPPRLKIEAVLDTLDHRLGDSNLGYAIGPRALGVNDDPGFVVDQIIGVVSEKGISVLPGYPCRLWIGQRDLFWRLASFAATALNCLRTGELPRMGRGRAR